MVNDTMFVDIWVRLGKNMSNSFLLDTEHGGGPRSIRRVIVLRHERAVSVR
jgi:hypothetical protein